jgi:hypothetical protein
LVILQVSIAVVGQESAIKEGIEKTPLRGTHRLSIVLGHSHLSEGIMDNGKRGWKIIPSWGFDYDYWITDHWAVGIQNEMMIESFEVEDHENTVLERTRPVSSIAAVIFKPGEHFSFSTGAGGE